MSSGRTVMQTFVRRWQAWRRQPPSKQPPQDVTSRGLADAALARADVISARDQVRHDTSRMMSHFGVDPGQVPSRFRQALRDAERTCAQCLVVGHCQHWFHGRLSDNAPRSFCPNAELFEDIAVSQGQACGSKEEPTA